MAYGLEETLFEAFECERCGAVHALEHATDMLLKVDDNVRSALEVCPSCKEDLLRRGWVNAHVEEAISVRTLVLSDEELLGMQLALRWALITANNMAYGNKDAGRAAVFSALLDKVEECAEEGSN